MWDWQYYTKHSHIQPFMWGIFDRILLIPYNIVMNLNNVTMYHINSCRSLIQVLWSISIFLDWRLGFVQALQTEGIKFESPLKWNSYEGFNLEHCLVDKIMNMCETHLIQTYLKISGVGSHRCIGIVGCLGYHKATPCIQPADVGWELVPTLLEERSPSGGARTDRVGWGLAKPPGVAGVYNQKSFT